METMKAARWHGKKDVRIEEVEVPEVQPHQVKVAVKFTGICGTDLPSFIIAITNKLPHICGHFMGD